MSFILFVLSWFLPYAIFRMDKQRAEKIHNAHLRLGRTTKNPGARLRHIEAKRLAAIKSAAVMVVIELPFLFLVDEFTGGGLVAALGVATGAFMIAVMSMPSFEKSSLAALDREATDIAIDQGKKPDSWEFLKDNDHYLQPEVGPAVGDHGSATVESAEQSGMIDYDAMAPVKKGGR